MLRRLGSKATVHGEGNELDLGKARLHRVRIEIEGNHNRVCFHPTCKLVHTSFRLIGNNLTVELEEQVKISQWGEPLDG